MKVFDWKNKDTQKVVAAFFVSLILSGLWHFLSQETPSDKTQLLEKKGPVSIDTFIPHGFVLVPIEVYNLEALNSVLGDFGVVDLYTVASQGQTHTKQTVAKGLRILRAPKNPQQFAVLAPENQAAKIARSPTPFYVVIQNPDKAQNKVIESSKKPSRTFTTGDDS